MFKLAYQIKRTKKSNYSTDSVNLNSIFWFVDKINDLPAWYTLDNPTLKIVGIPKPDNEVREKIIRGLVGSFPDFQVIEGKKRNRLVNIFLDHTEKMFVKDLSSIVQFMLKDHIRFVNISDAIRFYKLGISENRWAKIPKNKIFNGKSLLKRRLKGQDHAITKGIDIIKRGYIGISGSQWAKYSDKPRGTLFLAGPTGVGKTELAKAITELIFGSEQNYIRFDMSEFNHEHADQRLIGAPPGYIGYEVGGELTNAIKQNPFAVILFDEIEKAHPRILDKFLQILEDGRLTDGRGDTVYFSESLIIFTSNLGVYEEDKETGERKLLISPNDDYEKVKSKILNKIEKFFKFEIQRPEILNRLGKNIIVFDFIREPVAKDIFNKMMENVLTMLSENKKINIKIADEIYNQILSECTKDLSMGGRGIGNNLEEIFVNPLSRSLFDDSVNENSTYYIEKVFYEKHVWNIKGHTN
jgi:ATP-dependent Clp protease ATP-binding subunit ClpA